MLLSHTRISTLPRSATCYIIDNRGLSIDISIKDDFYRMIPRLRNSLEGIGLIRLQFRAVEFIFVIIRNNNNALVRITRLQFNGSRTTGRYIPGFVSIICNHHQICTFRFYPGTAKITIRPYRKFRHRACTGNSTRTLTNIRRLVTPSKQVNIIRPSDDRRRRHAQLGIIGTTQNKALPWLQHKGPSTFCSVGRLHREQFVSCVLSVFIDFINACSS